MRARSVIHRRRSSSAAAASSASNTASSARTASRIGNGARAKRIAGQRATLSAIRSDAFTTLPCAVASVALMTASLRKKIARFSLSSSDRSSAAPAGLRVSEARLNGLRQRRPGRACQLLPHRVNSFAQRRSKPSVLCGRNPSREVEDGVALSLDQAPRGAHERRHRLPARKQRHVQRLRVRDQQKRLGGRHLGQALCVGDGGGQRRRGRAP